MKKLFPSAVFSLLSTLAFLHAEPFPMEFVPVRDPGNVADSTTKLGAVSTPYPIGK